MTAQLHQERKSITATAKKLTELRREVEKNDKKIVFLLQKRFVLTGKIQKLKKKLGMPITVRTREKKLLHEYSAEARRKGIAPHLIKSLFSLLFSYAKKTGIIKRI